MALCSKSWTDINIDFGEKRIKHCCKAASEGYDTLTESFINFSDGIVTRREQSKNNIKNAQCDYCWKHDSRAGASYRDIYNKSIDVNQSDDDLVEFVELKFDNVCNLGCLYCSEIDSSTIAKEKNLPNSITKHNDSDVEVVTQYIQKLLKRNKELRINMLGGEPTLSKGYHQFIKNLIETDANDNNIVLITTSNGNMHKNVLDTLISYMEQTKWSWVWGFSGESTNSVFENVRHGGDWSQWNNNLTVLSSHKKTLCISFNPTVNLLTVKDFPNYIKHITNSKKIYMLNPNFVLQPIELSVAKAPKSFKSYIEQAKDIFDSNNEFCLNKKEVYTWFNTLINTVGTEDLNNDKLLQFLNLLNRNKKNTLDTNLLMEQINE